MRSLKMELKVVFEKDNREPGVQTMDDMTDELNAWMIEFAKARGIKVSGSKVLARFSEGKLKP